MSRHPSNLALVDNEHYADDDPNRTPPVNTRERSGSLLIGLLARHRRSDADVTAKMARDACECRALAFGVGS
jgi:hypothetical protein